VLFRIADAVRLPVDVRLLGTKLERMMSGLRLRANDSVEIYGDILQTLGELSEHESRFHILGVICVGAICFYCASDLLLASASQNR